MEYSAELLLEAGHYSALFYGSEDLSTILALPIEQVRIALDLNDELGLAIKAGRLKSDAEFRTAVITLAKQGSSPAQALTMQLIQHLEG